jgi:hypothetical protein
VTAIVREIPPPLTFTVPLRLAVPVFAVALTVKLPLLVPEVGETLSQVWSSLTVQLTFEVTAIGDEDAEEASDSEVGAIVRLLVVCAADCVTDICRVMPPPVTVTVPLRLAVPVFAVALTVKLPLPVPEMGETLSHV